MPQSPASSDAALAAGIVAETLAARDRAIAALTERAEAAEAALSALRAELEEARKAAEIAQARAIAIEAEAAARMVPFLAQAGRDLEAAVTAERALRRAALVARDQAAEQALAAHRAQTGEMAREREARRRAEARLAQVYASTSWRVAAPVRWLGRLGRLGRRG